MGSDIVKISFLCFFKHQYDNLNMKTTFIRPNCDRQIFLVWITTISFSIGCWFMALIVFPKQFTMDLPISSFAEYYIDGQQNSLSFVFYAISMGIFCMGWFFIGKLMYNSFEKYISILPFAASIGCVFSAFPNDLYHDYHVFGTALWAYCLVMMITIWIIQLRSSFPSTYIYLSLILFYGVAITYSVLFFGEYKPACQYAQKVAFVFGILYALGIPLLRMKCVCRPHFHQKGKNICT